MAHRTLKVENYKPKRNQTLGELGRSFVGRTIDGSKVKSWSPCKNGFSVWLTLEDGRQIHRTRNDK